MLSLPRGDFLDLPSQQFSLFDCDGNAILLSSISGDNCVRYLDRYLSLYEIIRSSRKKLIFSLAQLYIIDRIQIVNKFSARRSKQARIY